MADHNLIWNRRSFQGTAETCSDLLKDATKGMLHLLNPGDRISMFCVSGESLRSQHVCAGFTYGDFLAGLEAKGDMDLLSALSEIIDKSPALDQLDDDALLEIADATFYFADNAFDGSVDEVALAWKLDGMLFSIATEPAWTSPTVNVAIYKEGLPVEPWPLGNLAVVDHGKHWRTYLDQLSAGPGLVELYPQCSISTEFLEWFQALSDDNQTRVKSKLNLAAQREFSGGEPLFKTLNEAEGLREIRLSAFPGGAIRILFGAIPNGRQGLFLGFIKKSNDEGYGQAIPKALDLWKACKAAHQVH